MSQWRIVELDLTTARTMQAIACHSGGVMVWRTNTPDVALSIDFDRDNGTLETPVRAGNVWEGDIEQLYVTHTAQPGRTVTLALFGDYGDGSAPIRPRSIDADAGRFYAADHYSEGAVNYVASGSAETVRYTATADTLIVASAMWLNGNGPNTLIARIRAAAGGTIYAQHSHASSAVHTGQLVGLVLKPGNVITTELDAGTPYGQVYYSVRKL